ncbi:MAG: PLP-dependent aminotransferase family protein [Acidimicrobiia bacterium]
MNVVELLRLELRTRTPQSVASALSRLIHAGTIPAGAKLPTIREVASGLQMSPTQVGEAWTLLARAGVVRTEGRRGTFVGVERLEPASPRFWQASREVGAYAIDLGTGTPDSELLPDLGPALARLANTAMVSNYLEPATLPTLDRLLRANWADLFDPEAVVIVDGALDGLDRICRELVRYGDRVVVEDPALPTIFDVVESNGGIALGVGLDEEGVRPDELARALRSDPVLVILQPRAQNPTGVSMSPERAADLARLLRDSSAIVVEDDHTGAVASAPPVTLSAWLPTRTLHVSAFSKSHGPDLRLAAVAGPLPFITALSIRRRMGPAWSSRLLQSVLLDLLLDPATNRRVEHARAVYQERRRRLVEALARHGVTVGGSDGFNLWVPVEDEDAARAHLAQHGIGVRPGRPFALTAGPDHLRVTCSRPLHDVEGVAALLAAAAGRSGPERPRPHCRSRGAQGQR